MDKLYNEIQALYDINSPTLNETSSYMKANEGFVKLGASAVIPAYKGAGALGKLGVNVPKYLLASSGIKDTVGKGLSPKSIGTAGREIQEFSRYNPGLFATGSILRGYGVAGGLAGDRDWETNQDYI